MSFFSFGPLTTLCYGFLYLTVLLLWFPVRFKRAPWVITLGVAAIFGFLSHHVYLFGLEFIILLSLFLKFSKSTHLFIRGIFGLLALVLSAALMMHVAPGFNNLKVLNDVYVSTNGVPFSLYLNFDKVAAGILIIGLTHSLISSSEEWRRMFKEMIPRAIIVIAVVAVLSFLLGFVQFDFKIPDSLWIWIPTNLLFVCLAEEAFFRGFIQKNLMQMFSKIKFGNWWAIGIASVLFGLAHYTGGSKYMILAMISGVGYGWVYERTRRIEASILTHFGLNLIHFLVFTYPALKSTV